MHIIQFKCSNEHCTMHVSLHGSIPIFKKGTPEESQYVPVSIFNRKYLAGTRSDAFCWGCRAIVTVNDGSDGCPNCHTREFFMKPGWACRACNLGVIQEIEGGTRWF